MCAHLFVTRPETRDTFLARELRHGREAIQRELAGSAKEGRNMPCAGKVLLRSAGVSAPPTKT